MQRLAVLTSVHGATMYHLLEKIWSHLAHNAATNAPPIINFLVQTIASTVYYS